MNIKYKDFEINDITIEEFSQLIKLMGDSQETTQITYPNPYAPQPYIQPYAPWYPNPIIWDTQITCQDHINTSKSTGIQSWNSAH